MATLERGFKSWCERVASAMRVELKLEQHAPLPARILAAHLAIEIVTPFDLTGLPADILTQLTQTDRSGWSAVSFTVDDVTTIIVNSRHSIGRQSSNIMHELAHVILEHEPSQLILLESGQFAMRSFDAKQEDEANWLGWTLLLPRAALMLCAARHLTPAAIATEYGVSEQLVSFRRHVTGIDMQTRQRRRTK